MTRSGGWAYQVTIVAHDVAGAGGMERQLRELVVGLLDRGVRVVVVSRTLGLPDHPALRWHQVPGPSRPFVVAYPWFAAVASLMLLRTRRGLLHVTGAIVLNRADICTVHYLHRGDDDIVRASRSSVAYRLHARLARWLSREFERLLYRRSALTRMLVAVSPRAAQELVDAFPRRADSVRVVRHGVDAHRFRPDVAARAQTRRELGLADTANVAVFVGSEWEGKGLAVAVEALRLAHEWELVVVGSGDAERLMSLSAAVSVASRVHLVGETGAPERYYAAADVFVLPSASETFSLATLEAAAAGLGVIATDVGIVRDLAEAGGAILVDRDASSVAAALVRLDRDPGARRQLGVCARAYAAALSWNAVIADYVALYEEASGAFDSEHAQAAAGGVAP